MKPSPLDDADYRRFAWDRYRNVMAWMVLAAAVTVAAGLLYLKHTLGTVSVHAIIATVLGLSLSVALGGALMGLVFLSAGSGHDDSIVDLMEDDR